jgi:hypothetical protein
MTLPTYSIPSDPSLERLHDPRNAMHAFELVVAKTDQRSGHAISWVGRSQGLLGPLLDWNLRVIHSSESLFCAIMSNLRQCRFGYDNT